MIARMEILKKRRLSRGPETRTTTFESFTTLLGDWLESTFKCRPSSPVLRVVKDPAIKEEMLAPACSVGCASYLLVRTPI